MSKEVKSIYLGLLLSVVSVVLHNYLYFLLKKEEGVFFILAFLALIVFVFALIYSLTKYVTEKKPEDLWKVGFLGVLGFLGLVPQLGQVFFGFFGFALFFSLKGGYDSKIALKNIALAVALVCVIGTLSFVFYQTVKNNQDDAYFFLNFMKEQEMLEGIDFTDLDKVVFVWPGNTEPVSGKGFREMTITNEQYDQLRDFFQAAGFEIDFFDIEPTTNAGVSGYKKDSVWCVLKAGFYYDENGDPIPEDRLRCEISCAQM
ncbi:MAG: hypothetical protein WC410_01730 [Candidatus Paceibacterota bacterium]|jgi:hypothetical protein